MKHQTLKFSLSQEWGWWARYATYARLGCATGESACRCTLASAPCWTPCALSARGTFGRTEGGFTSAPSATSSSAKTTSSSTRFVFFLNKVYLQWINVRKNTTICTSKIIWNKMLSSIYFWKCFEWYQIEHGSCFLNCGPPANIQRYLLDKYTTSAEMQV